MDMNSSVKLPLLKNAGDPKPMEEIPDGRFVRLETHIDWLRHDVTEIKSELKDVHGEIKDVHGEIKDIRKNMQSDFRLVFSALIVVALGLSGLIAKGFHWL